MSNEGRRKSKQKDGRRWKKKAREMNPKEIKGRKKERGEREERKEMKERKKNEV